MLKALASEKGRVEERLDGAEALLAQITGERDVLKGAACVCVLCVFVLGDGRPLSSSAPGEAAAAATSPPPALEPAACRHPNHPPPLSPTPPTPPPGQCDELAEQVSELGQRAADLDNELQDLRSEHAQASLCVCVCVWTLSDTSLRA